MERAEKIGLGVATVGHVLLFALLSVNFLRAPNPIKLNPDPMQVSLVDEIALKSTAPQTSNEPPPPSEAPEKGPTEDAAPAPAPEPEPTPAPPAPKAKPAPPEPTPEPPKPKPTPAPPKTVAVKPTPKAKPLPQKPAPAKAKPAPEKPKAAAAPSAPAKSKPTAKPAAPSAPAKSKPTQTTSAKPAAQSGQGKAERPRGSRLGSNFLKGIEEDTNAPPKNPAPPPAAAIGAQAKAALNAEISRQLKPYWKAPTGADADQLVTILRWRLNRDGTLADGPSVVDQTGVTPSNRPQAALHQENAMKAVRAAAPFRLPPEYYDTWKNIVSFRFDKRL